MYVAPNDKPNSTWSSFLLFYQDKLIFFHLEKKEGQKNINYYFNIILFSDVFASIAPVAGAPLIGFGDLPGTPMSLIDIHGINDDTIPFDMAHAEGNKGEPSNSL